MTRPTGRLSWRANGGRTTAAVGARPSVVKGTVKRSAAFWLLMVGLSLAPHLAAQASGDGSPSEAALYSLYTKRHVNTIALAYSWLSILILDNNRAVKARIGPELQLVAQEHTTWLFRQPADMDKRRKKFKTAARTGSR